MPQALQAEDAPAPPLQAVRAAYDYDAFASYTTVPDYALVRDLERFLESFHELPTPDGVSLPPLRICVDGSDLPASIPRSDDAAPLQTEVWDLLERCLARSRTLVVFASHRAAQAPWVAREVEWFLTHRGPEHILLVLTEGQDPGRNPEAVIPRALLDAGVHRRPWYDLRGWDLRRNADAVGVRDLDDARTALAAHLLGRSAGEVQPLWFRERRRRARRRLVTGIGVTVALGATGGGALFAAQRASAEAERAELLDATEQGTRARLLAAVEPGSERTALQLGVRAAGRLLARGVTPPALALEGLDTAWHAIRARITLTAHDAQVRTLAWEPKGEWLVSGDDSGRVLLMDARTGVLRRELSRHPAAVTAVTVSPEGSSIASATERGSIRLDSPEGSVLHELPASGAAVRRLAFSPDGGWLAAIDEQGYTVRLHLASRTSQPGRHGAGIPSSYDGAWTGGRWLTVGADGVVRAWGGSTAGSEEHATLTDAQLQGVAVASDGRMALSGKDALGAFVEVRGPGASDIKRVRLATGARVLRFSSSGSLVVGTWDRALWLPAAGGEAREFFTRTEVSTVLPLEQEWVVVVMGSGRAYLWNARTNVQSPLGGQLAGGVDTGAAVSLGTRVAAAGLAGPVVLWDLASPEDAARTFSLPTDGTCVTWRGASPLVGLAGGGVASVDPESGALHPRAKLPGRVRFVTESSSGAILAGDMKGGVTLVPAQGEPLTWSHPAGAVTGAFLAGGASAVTIGQDGSVRVRGAAGTQDLAGPPPGFIPTEMPAAWSTSGPRSWFTVTPDGTVRTGGAGEQAWTVSACGEGARCMVTAAVGLSEERLALGWSDIARTVPTSFIGTFGPSRQDAPATLRLPATVAAHRLLASPDGTRFLVGRSDGKAMLCDAHLREPCVLLEVAAPEAPGEVEALAFSLDGKLAAAAAQNGPVVVADGRTGAVLMRRWGGASRYGLAFSPDSKWLALVGHGLSEPDRTPKLRLFRVDAPWLLERACELLGPGRESEEGCAAGSALSEARGP